MAINRLRQQNLFDQYGMLSMPEMDMMGPSPEYEDIGPSQQGIDPYQIRAAQQGPYTSPGPFSPTELPPEATEGAPPSSMAQAPVMPVPTYGLPKTPNDADARLDRTIEAINRVYTPSTVDRDRFRGLLDDVPEREEPSLGRRIVAAGAFLGNKSRGIPGGFAEQEKVLYAPYMRDMADWTAKTTPFSQASQQENTANINERTLAGNVVTAQTNADRLMEQGRIADDKNRLQQQKIDNEREIGLIRARAYAYAQRLGKGYEFDVTGPTIKMMNKSTGDVVDTGMATGKLDEETRIELQNYGRIEAARVTGEAAAGRVQAGGGGVFIDPQGRTWQNTPEGWKEIPGRAPGPLTKPGAQPQTPNTATERMKARQETLNALWDNMPEARPFLKKEGPVVRWADRPGYSWFSSDAYDEEQMRQYDILRKKYDPDYVSPVTPKKEGGESVAPAPPQVSEEATKGIGPQKVPTLGNQPVGSRAANPFGSYSPSTPTPSVQMGPRQESPIEQRAAEYLIKNGQKASLANIQIAIREGWVK